MLRLYTALCFTFVLSACNISEPSMSSVMSSCEYSKSFNSYASCIKSNYKRYPDRRITRAFYAQLNAISDDLKNGRTSESRARADAHLAYEQTIGQDNARRQRSYQNQMLLNQINRPKTTNCNSFGSSITCNSW